MNGQLIAVFGGALELIQIAQVQLRVNSLAKQVHPQSHQVNVSCPFAIAKQTPFDAVGACHIAKLGSGNSCSPIVVGVQAQNDVLSVIQMPRHPLDRIGIHIRGRHFYRRRQINHEFARGAGNKDLHHPVADLDSKLQLGAGVALWRVFVENL